MQKPIPPDIAERTRGQDKEHHVMKKRTTSDPQVPQCLCINKKGACKGRQAG